MEVNIAATYTLIYHFLKQQSQHKAAQAVKKAAKTIVVLHDDIEQEGAPLEQIVQAWKKENTKSESADSSSEDTDSDDSSSDSEDGPGSDATSRDTSGSGSEHDDTSDNDDNGDSSEDSDKPSIAKKPPQKAERDTSATLSSAGGNSPEVGKHSAQTPKEKLVKNADRSNKDESESSDSDSSDSDGSSGSSDSDSSDAEPSSSGSDASDSSDKDEANANKKNTKNAKKSTEDKKSSSSELSSDSEDDSDSDSQREEDARVAKKRKTSENGAVVTTVVGTEPRQQMTRVSQGKEKPPLKVKERFQRVKVQATASELLLNNGYEARGGATNDYGERAHRDLIVTRGAGFRKEKNKKKRGSYRGGEITLENHSIKFDF